jgi:hypothetical protein
VVSGLFQRPMVDRLTLNVSAICAAQVLAGKSLMSWCAGYLGCDCCWRFMGVLGELGGDGLADEFADGDALTFGFSVEGFAELVVASE